jgi:hypothetical protein
MHQESKKTSRISRREFALQAALGTATAACLPGELLARPLISRPESAQEIKLSPASQAEVDAKIQAILRKYGDRLSEAQKADIYRLVTEGQAPLEKMRAFPLDNSDQPGNVFKVYPDAAASSAPEPSR